MSLANKIMLPPPPENFQPADANCPYCGQRQTVRLVEINGEIKWEFLPHTYGKGEKRQQCPTYKFANQVIHIGGIIQTLIDDAQTSDDLHLIDIMLGAKLTILHRKQDSR